MLIFGGTGSRLFFTYHYMSVAVKRPSAGTYQRLHSCKVHSYSSIRGRQRQSRIRSQRVRHAMRTEGVYKEKRQLLLHYSWDHRIRFYAAQGDSHLSADPSNIQNTVYVLRRES